MHRYTAAVVSTHINNSKPQSPSHVSFTLRPVLVSSSS